MYATTSEPIDIAALEAHVRSEHCGAVVTFCGIVRDRSDEGRPVTGLSYEAHDAMAAAEFERIAAQAAGNFGECRIAVIHRTGDLRIGEVAVAVVAASPHRGVAFDACEYVIDELKARAPIWKKEHYADGGDSLWKENACHARPISLRETGLLTHEG
jgi:molybdopterin synthase catalytic subunit